MRSQVNRFRVVVAVVTVLACHALLVAQAAAQSVAEAAQHSGELTPAALGTITVAAGVLSRIFAPLFSQTERVQRIVAIAVSAVILASWAYSEHSYARENLFALISAFGTVALSTLGLSVLTNPAALSSATHTLTGGRVGTKDGGQ